MKDDINNQQKYLAEWRPSHKSTECHILNEIPKTPVIDERSGLQIIYYSVATIMMKIKIPSL